jgi:uncharacterized protein (TIGR02246 family)
MRTHKQAAPRTPPPFAFLLAALTLLLLLLATPAVAQQPDRGEDRAAIHALLVAYGETIDARDFDGFAALFAEGGTYAGGAGGAGVPGAEAAEALERTFEENALGLGEPNYHLFFNEVVRFTGPDSATVTSKSLFMAPGEGGRPEAAMMAAYADELVREGGTWKFARRQVTGLMPAPAPAPLPGDQ